MLRTRDSVSDLLRWLGKSKVLRGKWRNFMQSSPMLCLLWCMPCVRCRWCILRRSLRPRQSRVAFHSKRCLSVLPPLSDGRTVSFYWKTAESRPSASLAGSERLGKISWRRAISKAIVDSGGDWILSKQRGNEMTETTASLVSVKYFIPSSGSPNFQTYSPFRGGADKSETKSTKNRRAIGEIEGNDERRKDGRIRKKWNEDGRKNPCCSSCW